MAKEELIPYINAKLAEARHLAKEKTEDQGEKLHKRRAFLRLEKHINDFLDGKVENRIIILPGLRGVGKTTLQLQAYNYLTLDKKINPARVLYFSEDEAKEYIGASITDVINTYIEDVLNKSLVNLDEKIFIFIDEAHFDRNWSTAAKIVYDKSKKVFLIITGSSALSMEMSVDLVRRAKKEAVFPLNFSEYLVLKYREYPIKGTAATFRNAIFQPSQDNIKKAQNLWNELGQNYLKIGKPLKKAFEEFLIAGGFPFSIKLDQKSTFEKTFGMIDRIIEKDIFALQTFKTDTRNTISRIIYYLALQHPGETSDSKLSQRLDGTSSNLVRSILDILEKAHLVISLKPYGGATRIIKKAWKYYFLSPSLNSSIRFKLKEFKPNDAATLGLLAESFVATEFFRMKELINTPTSISFDGAKEGVDFLITNGPDNIIPVEVCIGKKNTRQVKKAIGRYKAKYGVIISDEDKIKFEDKILHLPIIAFSLV